MPLMSLTYSVFAQTKPAPAPAAKPSSEDDSDDASSSDDEAPTVKKTEKPKKKVRVSAHLHIMHILSSVNSVRQFFRRRF